MSGGLLVMIVEGGTGDEKELSYQSPEAIPFYKTYAKDAIDQSRITHLMRRPEEKF